MSGISAFAHKAGIHAAAVKRNPKAYEHLNPELVGNVRHIPVSDLSGRSSIFLKAKELGLDPAAHDREVQFALDKIRELDLKIPPKSTEALQTILEKVKDLEAEGHQFETAEASLELLLRAALGQYQRILPPPELPGGGPEGGGRRNPGARSHHPGAGGAA